MTAWKHSWALLALLTTLTILAYSDRFNNHAKQSLFSGSKSCAECHPKEWEEWRNSHHALAEIELNHSDITIINSQDDNDTPLKAIRQIGVSPLKQFIVDHNGNLQVHQMAQDTNNGEWFNVFNDGRQAGEWGHWTGRGMNWDSMCATCHNTGVTRSWDASNDRFKTSVSEFGVGCEACHGEGRNHVEWQNKFKGQLGDPYLDQLNLSSRPGGIVDACGPCHARRAELGSPESTKNGKFLDAYLPDLPDEDETWFSDGQIREENFEYSSFLMSKMHLAGVTCLDCHTTHTAKLTLQGNALCMQCHSGSGRLPGPIIDESTHSGHAINSPGNQCVNCHMPTTTYMQRHPRRDHSFTVPDPILSEMIGVPNACTSCHENQTLEWATREISSRNIWQGKNQVRRRAMAISATRNEQEDALERLLEAIQKETHPTWRFILLNLLRLWPKQKDIEQLLFAASDSPNDLIRIAANPKETLLQDPVLAVRLSAAQKMDPQFLKNRSIEKELWKELQHNSGQPGTAMREATYWMIRNEPLKALEASKWAELWEPNSPAPLHSQASALDAIGDTNEAAEIMEKCCKKFPEDSLSWYLLGLGRAGNGNLLGAREALIKALTINPKLEAAKKNLSAIEAIIQSDQ